jgi:hypothetical protein
LPGSNAKARAKSARRKRGSCSRYGALTRLGRGISKAFQRQRELKFNSLKNASATRQYAHVVHDWIESAGMDSAPYGTHSLRRTKVAQIYRKTGNLRAV